MQRKAILILMVCAFVALSPVLAQDDEKPTEFLSMSHDVMVKPGSELAFEEALKAHWAIHKKQGDEQGWETWTQVTGKHAGLYSIRSGGLTWADLDKSELEGDQADVMKNLMPNMKWSSTKIVQWNLDASNWGEDVGTPKMVEITVFHLKPGKEKAFWHALGKVTEFLKGNDDIPWQWAWGYTVSGGSGGDAILAIPHENWASFKDDGINMWKMLEEAQGRIAADHLMDAITEGIKWQENYAVMHRPDLSYTPAE